MNQKNTAHEKPRILFGWQLKPELQAFFQTELSEIAETVFAPGYKTEELLPLIPQADIFVGGVFTDELLTAAEKLKLLVIPYIGVERHVPIVRPFPGITLVNSRGNAAPTAQHAVALMLAVTNHVVHFHKRVENGDWRAYDDTPPSLLLDENTTVGVLGAGTVGRQIIRLLAGFPVRVIGCSRGGGSLEEFPDLEMFSAGETDAFYRQSNIVMVGVPKTADTDGMIGERELGLLPENAILVNVARGSVIDEKPLFEALKSRQLLGAGLDVWYNYRPEEIDGKKYPYTEPFHALDNVVLSPHRAGSPLVRTERFRDIVENIHRWVNGEPLRYVIDLEAGY